VGIEKFQSGDAAGLPGAGLESLDQIIESLRNLYLADDRPWFVGYSGGKDSTMLVSVVFEALRGIEPATRQKDICIVCTDTRVEIPAVAERISAELDLIRDTSSRDSLGVSAHLLSPMVTQTFWVNIIGRGYPPPNRSFRWCTQRMKIDPVSDFIRGRLGAMGEAIILLGARRNESGTRAQTMAARERRAHNLHRHKDLTRCWVATPLEYLSADDVWEYLMTRPNPWGGNNQELFNLYKNAAGGECPLVVDQTTPSCGNSRFGCWTCTVVEKDKASEGLLASGDNRMEALIQFRDTLIQFRDPEQGYRDNVRKNGSLGPGPLKLAARKELLRKLLELQQQTGLKVISDEELHVIQGHWNSARHPDIGTGVAEIVHFQRGTTMPDLKDDSQLRTIEADVARIKGVSEETLRRLIAKVEEYGESHRAQGLPDELLQILQDELREKQGSSVDLLSK
jgi:DNA sulfur modification protein DndC